MRVIGEISLDHRSNSQVDGAGHCYDWSSVLSGLNSSDCDEKWFHGPEKNCHLCLLGSFRRGIETDLPGPEDRHGGLVMFAVIEDVMRDLILLLGWSGLGDVLAGEPMHGCSTQMVSLCAHKVYEWYLPTNGTCPTGFQPRHDTRLMKRVLTG